MGIASMISVIVPVYKVEQYLDSCIRSLVGQNYQNLEIILVDDGSPDNCPAMCDTWALKDSRIKVIHKENGGGAQARNTGLEVARGDYIAFVDSDDYLFPDMYEKLLKTIVENQCDIAECEYVEVDSDEYPAVELSEEHALVLGTEDALRENIKDRICRQLVWNKLYRADVIGEIRFVERKFIDDEFFTYRVLGNAKKIAVIGDQLYCYRQQAGSAMHQTYSLKRLDALDAKLLRVQYMEAYHPALVELACCDLWFSGIYALQKAMCCLPKAEYAVAHRKTKAILNECGKTFSGATLPRKQFFWLVLSRISLWGTCWLRNQLRIGL